MLRVARGVERSARSGVAAVVDAESAQPLCCSHGLGLGQARVSASPKVVAVGETNVGRKRTHNEDSFDIVEESNLYLVADGMGGHASGEVASQLAIKTLREFYQATDKDPDATWPYKMDKALGYEQNRLATGIKLANLRIHQSAQDDPQYRGMGTTLVACVAIHEGILIGHVGDSRVYRVRDGQMSQLTEDHSLLNDYIKMRRLSQDEIANFPHKNVIVRALGMKQTVKVDTALDKPEPGDRYILCSDGLAGPASDEEIHEVAIAEQDPKAACEKLIAKANDNGGPDNITVVILDIPGP